MTLVIYECFREILRYIDHEISHAFILAQDIHIVDTCRIILFTGVNSVNYNISECVSIL